MSARPAPSRRTAARPTTPRPKGTRLPHPGALTRFAQWLALACVLLALAGLYASPWAEQRLAEQAATTREQRLDSHARSSSDARPRFPLPTLPPLEVAAPQLVRWLYAPPQSTLLWLIAALDMALAMLLRSAFGGFRHVGAQFLRERAVVIGTSAERFAIGGDFDFDPRRAHAPISSRPISMRRISLVPAPMSSSLASRR